MEIEVNGIKIFYEQIGNGPPIVLNHGNGADHKVFDCFIKKLSSRYTIYMPDSRGHGKSEAVAELHYNDMADDMYEFINKLNLQKPIFYGLSDGGIVGLLLAIKHPYLLSKLIVSGANTNPYGLKLKAYLTILWTYIRKRTIMLRLILKEPHITTQQLRKIRVPTLVLAGEKDIVRKKHTQALANAIPEATLSILPNEGHVSYIEHSDTAYDYMKDFLSR